MYWLRILLRRQNNILRNISAPPAAEIFHFHMDSVHMFPSHRQYSLEYFGAESCQNITFLHVSSAHIILKANQYFQKYFGTNCCQKISLSQGFSAHVPRATNNIPWSISLLRAAEIFHFHKDSLHTFLEPKEYSPEYLGTENCWNISFLHVLSAHIIPKAN